MMEAEQPTKALTADDVPPLREQQGIGVDELLGDALMRPPRLQAAG